MEKNGVSNSGAEWDERATIADNIAIGVNQCAVQFSGKRALSLNRESLTVPLPIFLMAAAQVLQLIASDHPAGVELRRIIGGAQVQRVTPPTH